MKKYYSIIFLIFLLVLVFLWIPNPISGSAYMDINNDDDLKNILVEFHGLVFDLFIFGVLLSFYDHYNQRRQNIQRYRDTIEHLRFGISEEVKLKLIGSIKELLKLGVNNLDLNGIKLEQIKLTDLKFKDSILKKASFSGTNLRGSKFYNCDCISTDFSNTILTDSKFNDCKFIETDFRGAEIDGLKIESCKIVGIKISKNQQSFFQELENIDDNSIFVID